MVLLEIHQRLLFPRTISWWVCKEFSVVSGYFLKEHKYIDESTYHIEDLNESLWNVLKLSWMSSINFGKKSVQEIFHSKRTLCGDTVRSHGNWSQAIANEHNALCHCERVPLSAYKASTTCHENCFELLSFMLKRAAASNFSLTKAIKSEMCETMLVRNAS